MLRCLLLPTGSFFYLPYCKDQLFLIKITVEHKKRTQYKNYTASVKVHFLKGI